MLLKLPLYPRIIVVHGKIRSLRPDRSVLSQTHFSDHLTFHDQTVSREDVMPWDASSLPTHGLRGPAPHHTQRRQISGSQCASSLSTALPANPRCFLFPQGQSPLPHLRESTAPLVRPSSLNGYSESPSKGESWGSPHLFPSSPGL